MISLRSKVSQKLLAYYFINPSKRHYVNELARLLELDPKNVHTKLVEFEKTGLLSSEYRGRERFFSLNKKYPLLKAYREIVLKTGGVEDSLRVKLSGLSGGVREAYLFGSYAKGGMDENSDIDLLVVGEHSALELSKLLLPVKRFAGREINALSLSGAEFAGRKKKGDHLIRDIFKGKVIKLL